MKILVTGGDGLLGSALKSITNNHLQHTFKFSNHKNFDMTNKVSVMSLFKTENYDCIINCAAVVGGIKMNKESPAELFHENLMINANVIDAAHLIGIKKLFLFSSACAYPTDNYPLTEDIIQDGKPFIGNYAYGYAKRMVDIQVRAYNEQYGHNYCTLIPVSLYGPNDNFSIEDGHFIPALIHKAYIAKKNGQPLSVWGDGSPLRELIYAKDLANIIIKLAEMDKVPHDKYLIGSGVEVSVSQMAETIAKYMGIESVVYETNKPNGQHRKPADSSRLKSVIGDFNFTNFEYGINETITNFVENFEKLRT